MRDNYLGARAYKKTKREDSVHFNNNGVRLCGIFNIDPKHTTRPEEVTCGNCMVRLAKIKRRQLAELKDMK